MSRIKSLKSKRKSFAIVLAMFAIVGLLAAGAVLLNLGLQGRVFAIPLLIWVPVCLGDIQRNKRPVTT